MMTLRHMRYFDALANTMHFGRAASLVHISQPALSTQIAELEKTLGMQLVERGNSALRLTEAGQSLLPKIRAILAQVKAIEDEHVTFGEPLSGKISLGIIPTVAPYIIPKLLPLIRQHYPELEIELREAVTASLIDELLFGRIDTIIAALPIANANFEHVILFVDRFLVAVADNDRDVLAGPIEQEGFAPERLLLLEEGHCLREQALEVCQLPASRQRANFGATSLSTLLQMVSNGMGMTLIPEMAVEVEATRNAMRIVRFSEPEPSRTIGLLWRKSSTMKRDIKALGELIHQVQF